MDEVAAMKMALEEARRGAAGAPPNPPVGCVVLDSSGSLLATGYHEKFGGPHAEVNALKDLPEERLRGATVVVTLEPCAHEGKTPSCAKMLARLPIKRLIYGLIDPNPLVGGKGAEIIRQAGIEVRRFDGLREELEESCEAFLWNYRRQEVFTAVKVASSLDGQVALRSGESRWITGEAAREKAHEIRSWFDAVVTGVGTVLADDPRLDIRHPRIQKTNKVVVLDSKGRGLSGWKERSLVRAHALEDVLWFVGEEQAVASAEAQEFQKAGGRLIPSPLTSQGVLDVHMVFQELWRQGLRSVLVEAGPGLTSELLSRRLARRLYLFQAPLILGAGGGRAWSEGIVFSKLAEGLRLGRTEVQQVGPDLLFSARLTQD